MNLNYLWNYSYRELFAAQYLAMMKVKKMYPLKYSGPHTMISMTDLPKYLQENLKNMILDHHPVGAEWNQIKNLVFLGTLDAWTENLVISCQSIKAVFINLRRYSWLSISKPSRHINSNIFKKEKIFNFGESIPNQYKPLLDYILYFVRWEREGMVFGVYRFSQKVSPRT